MDNVGQLLRTISFKYKTQPLSDGRGFFRLKQALEFADTQIRHQGEDCFNHPVNASDA